MNPSFQKLLRPVFAPRGNARLRAPGLSLSLAFFVCAGNAQTKAAGQSSCEIRAVHFEGWQAQEISNAWVTLSIVPQLGGRVMQVTFAGHPYLFVNPQLKGKYYPPSDVGSKGHWFNYGGDKLWPLPEGTEDEQHWPGPVSDELDDGSYQFTVLSNNPTCTVRLEGPPDPKTGLQYTREISISNDSPKISFRAIMKNASGHAIRWSVQSVSQYDTSDAQEPAGFHRDFWAFTPSNERSAYFGGFHVRSGLADDPSFAIRDGLFRLHWIFLQNEVWIDSPGGWVAVVDGKTHYAMVERFHYQADAEYPGKATVIFYKNGPSLEVDEKGIPFVSVAKPEDQLHYMEAELNSPMVKMQAGETYMMETEWFPTRMGKEFRTVTSAGAIGTSLTASVRGNSLLLAGEFGVFFEGNLVAILYDRRGVPIRTISLQKVNPAEAVSLHMEIPEPGAAARVAVHLVTNQGTDSGSLGEAMIYLDGRM
jgi:hypothetical protein